MRPSCPAPQCLQALCHPSRFSPRTEAYPRNNPGKTFFGRKRCVISDTDWRGDKSTRLEQRQQAKARRMEHVEITMANGQHCGGSIPERGIRLDGEEELQVWQHEITTTANA